MLLGIQGYRAGILKAGGCFFEKQKNPKNGWILLEETRNFPKNGWVILMFLGNFSKDALSEKCLRVGPAFGGERASSFGGGEIS